MGREGESSLKSSMSLCAFLILTFFIWRKEESKFLFREIFPSNPSKCIKCNFFLATDTRCLNRFIARQVKNCQALLGVVWASLSHINFTVFILITAHAPIIVYTSYFEVIEYKIIIHHK